MLKRIWVFVIGMFLFLGATSSEAAVVIKARRLTNILLRPFFVHTYLAITPDNPSDFDGNDQWTFCAIRSKFSFDSLQNINRLTKMKDEEEDLNSQVVGQWKVLPPVGKSDTEFIRDIYAAFDRYEQYSYMYSPFYDSNRFTSSLLIAAGVPPEFLRSIIFGRRIPNFGKAIREMLPPSMDEATKRRLSEDGDEP